MPVGNRHGNAIFLALLSNRLIDLLLTQLRICTGQWVPGFRRLVASTLGRVKSILMTNPSNWGGHISMPSAAIRCWECPRAGCSCQSLRHGTGDCGPSTTPKHNTVLIYGEACRGQCITWSRDQ